MTVHLVVVPDVFLPDGTVLHGEQALPYKWKHRLGRLAVFKNLLVEAGFEPTFRISKGRREL